MYEPAAAVGRPGISVTPPGDTQNMATQLRLVDPPQAPRTRATRGTRATVAARGRTRAPRRAARWGDWQLDDRTRRIGREGIAAARQALEQSRAEDGLPRAS